MIDRLLASHLEPLIRRRRQCQFWAGLALVWLATGLAGLILLALRGQAGFRSMLPLVLLAALGGAAALVVRARVRRREPDYRWAAGQVEAEHPDLQGLLLTAVQQESEEQGGLSYLQTRLVRQAVDHSAASGWRAPVLRWRLALAHGVHLLALAFCLAVLGWLRPASVEGRPKPSSQAKAGMTVTPGDASLERGSSLVVMARFEGPVPASMDLVVGATPETSRRIPLVRNLADPLFGGSVPDVDAGFVYHLEYAGQRTRDYQVTVFEHPKLERANVGLTYPGYTGLAPKHLDDTRRLSAVEGTRLELTLQLNKPVVSARLLPKGEETNALSLVVESNRAVASISELPLLASKTYQLYLVDADGRSNKVPAQFVFEVLKNRKPEIKLASPRGDIRPSALEEVVFEGTVWDDFGVQAYGLAYALAGGEPKLIEMGRTVPGKEKHPFQHVLRLEDIGLKADDLVSWFVWADDVGPDGQVRRAAGDLFFAEVRPFEEIFREGQGGGAQSAQQQQSGEQSGQEGSPSAKLAELQKQIISATWKLWQDQGGSPKAAPAGDGKRGAQPSPRDPKTSALPQWKTAILLHRQSFMGQRAGGSAPGQDASRAGSGSAPSAAKGAGAKPPQFAEDAGVVRDSQAQALEQTETAGERVQDPRLAALWEAAAKEMTRALEKLKAAEKSPALLQEALAAEQAAYQALLKLQEREHSVSRSRNQKGSQGKSSRQQQMQQQLDQLDLQQSENRYESERQAQAPQSTERREQLQVMSRLAELARRQQDVNERLKELQTALQEARTEQQREELRRQLKRLQEEEQKMMADADELQQRMERAENQSRMSEQRRQLEQARQEMQRASDAAQQGAASQALAAGTRAQRQIQQIRDEMRRQNASEFAEDLREMRAEARELARQQEEIRKKMENPADRPGKNLSDSDQTKEILDRLARQKDRLTNLVSRATQVSQQAEDAEPLVSRELHDTLRKFSQEEAGSVKRMQEELVNSGALSRSLNERLKETGERETAKSLEVTSEMLREGLRPQASRAEARARSGIGDLRKGVERAAERVLGDDAEALRLAQRQLDQLTDQVEREMSQAQRQGGTNQQGQAEGSQPGQPGQTQQPGQGQQAQAGAEQQGGTPQAQGQDQGQQPGQSGRDGQGSERQPGQNESQQARERGQGQQPGQSQTPGEQGRSDGQSQQPGEQGKSQAQGQSQSQAQGQGQGQSQGQGQGQGQREGQQPSQAQPGQQGQGSQQGQGGPQQGEAAQSSQPGANPSQTPGEARQTGRGERSSREASARTGGPAGNQRRSGPQGGSRGGPGDLVQGWDWMADNNRPDATGPITGSDFAPWSDRLREVEEMVDTPSLRNEIATARERARQVRQDFKRDLKKPDWAVVRLQIINPLVEVRNQIAEELARREPKDKLVPIDRDPVPTKYSDLVRRYYEELGKEK